MSKKLVLEVRGLHHGFAHPAKRKGGKGMAGEDMAGGDIVLFENMDMMVNEGESVALLGSSGSGKSTLLHVLGLMADHQRGMIKFHGQDIAKLSAGQKNFLRGQNIGFVFQHHYLLAELTALENIALPLRLLRMGGKDSLERARVMLQRMGLEKRSRHYPSELSGGERQRVALARALVHAPTLLIADEPTGNLDSVNADMVFDMLLAEIQLRKMTAIIATHDWQRAKKCQKQFIVKNKKLLLMK